MTMHDDTTRLRHMLEHAREAISLAAGKTRDDLGNERTLELSLTRLVEIIGEAAARVSAEMRSKHCDIPWQEITGLRNRLVHGYDAVDLDILWNIVELDLPPLGNSLAAILEE